MEVVSVCMFNYFYVFILVVVLNSGVYVLCEKLMVILEEEVKVMIEVVKINGKKLMIGYN